jgi:gliding motility-associated-like protein
MQKLVRRLILFLTLTATIGIIPRKVLATHLAGSDITYTCLGGNSYRIDLTFYRDCLGTSAPPSVLLNFHSNSCNIDFNDYLLPANGTGQEITYPCPGLTTSCDDPSSPNPGIQEYRYTGVVNFPIQCSDWIISWQYCCRNCDITTIVVPSPCVPGSNPGMYISARLDNLNISCNNSPVFTNNPIVFVCVGQSFTYNHGAVDPDGDSLVYSLVDPRDSINKIVTWQPGYSATDPVQSSPGVTINQTTGDIVMNPTQQEVGILSVLVEEFRDGVKIGQVVRDMEIYVLPCTNNIPTATGMNGTPDHDTTVCPGTQLCFDIFSNDLDPNQVVTMSWNAAISGATFTISGFPFPTGHFCWTPTSADISTIPHTFTLTVVDNACPNSGYQTYSFTINVNSPLVTIDQTPITCHGANDGALNVVPVIPGGYSYLWTTGGETTSGISNLSPGSYPVTVYDSATGCSATFPNTILDPAILTAAASVVSAACTGSATGIAAATAGGGTAPYTYSWNTSPVTLNDTASGLAAGTYIVTVTDLYGCTATSSVNLTSSSTALIVTVDTIASVLNLLCFTDTTGAITVAASGGTPGYSYVWNTVPPQTGPTATGLGPGTYTVTVTDSFGCNNTIDTTVYSPPAIVSAGSAVPATCSGNDGSAYISSLTGGVPGYSYVWDGFPGNTSDSLFGVPSGFYMVTITDTNGCTNELGILVGNQVIQTDAHAIADVVCHGDSNAQAIIIPSQVGPPMDYIFLWTLFGSTDTISTDSIATGMPAGFYIVRVTDLNLCSAVDTVQIPDPPKLLVDTDLVNANCNGSGTGSATVHVSGGSAPYLYNWLPSGGSDSTATNLLPGNYTVEITDAAGCLLVVPVTIGQNTTMNLVVDSIVLPVCNGDNSGSIYITVSGGNSPYSYLWVPGNFITDDITNIDAGQYFVTVTDQTNCILKDTMVVSEPPPVPVFAGNDTAICVGSSFQLNATPPGAGITGRWSSTTINDTSFSNITDPNTTLNNIPPGYSTVTWTVTDGTGCKSSDDVQLFSFGLTAGPDISQCDLTPVRLNGTISSPLTGLWTAGTNVLFDNPNLDTARATLQDFGIDTLTWTVSGLACSSSDVMVIAAYQIPVAEAGDSGTVCSPNAKLKAIIMGPGAGMWSERIPTQATIADSSLVETTVSNLLPGVTVFVWTMTNGICSNADTVIVNYDEACELELPTAFTPNNDGFNDGYFIKGIDGYPNNFFTVFNRWGNLVYSKEDYVNTDWIGQDEDGNPLPEGTYFVLLQIKNSDIKKSTFVDLRRYSPK